MTYTTRRIVAAGLALAAPAVCITAEDQPYVPISPYPDPQDPLVASAWAAQLRLEEEDGPRLQDFIDRYAGNGPEPGADCSSGVEETVDAG